MYLIMPSIVPVQDPIGEVNNTVLIASNVDLTESDSDVWSSVTTYAEGDIVVVFDSYNRYYRATGATTDDYPPDVWEKWTDLGPTNRLPDAADAALYSASGNYVVGDIVYVGGSVQRYYESLTGTSDPEGEYNTDNYPPESASNWLDLGLRNRWKMFDEGTGTITERPDVIDVTIRPLTPINSIAFFNVSATQIYVKRTYTDDSFDDDTTDLFDNSFISGWYDYFFEPIISLKDKARVDFPAFGIKEIQVRFLNPDNIAKCGLLVIGRQKLLGTAVYGSSVSIKDYSRKETDDFGNFEVVKRRFSKLADYDIVMKPSAVRPVQQILASLRATPAVYIGDPDLDETVVYGYYRDFTIVLSDFATATTTLQVEGL